MRVAASVSGIALAILLAGCGHKPQVIQVEMKGIAYVPSKVQAHAGDTLVFTNRDFVPHTATARDKTFDSGSIAPDSSWRVVVSKDASFFCTFHPNMQGSIATH